MTPERANDIGYLLDNFEQCAVAAHAEQTDSADERLREAAKAITDLVDRLRAHIERIQEWGPDQRTQRERADIAEENLSAVLAQRDQVVEQLAAVEQDRDRLSDAFAEADREIERMRAGAWRDYSVEAWGEPPYETCVVCRSDGGCEWVRLNEDGKMLTLGEAVDAAREHVKWHAEQDAEAAEPTPQAVTQ